MQQTHCCGTGVNLFGTDLFKIQTHSSILISDDDDCHADAPRCGIPHFGRRTIVESSKHESNNRIYVYKQYHMAVGQTYVANMEPW